MTKYRLLKDLPGINKGSISDDEGIFTDLNGGCYEVDLFDIYEYPEWFEKVKEEPKPKFKIGDYVVYEGKNIEYMKIFLIKQSGENFVYNATSNTDGYSVSYYESHLRKPTQEELEKYFR